MKKIILLVVSACLSIAIANAQTDTTKTKSNKRSSAKSLQHYPTKDMKKIQSTDVPPALKTTLQDAEYAGWESGSWFYNSSSGEYAYQVEPPETDPTGSQKSMKNEKIWFRFDRNGKRIQETQKPQQ
jgi:hypothetical protein